MMKLINWILVVLQGLLFIPLALIPLTRDGWQKLSDGMGYHYLMDSPLLDFYSHKWVSIVIVLLAGVYFYKEFKVKIKIRLMINSFILIASFMLIAQLFENGFNKPIKNETEKTQIK